MPGPLRRKLWVLGLHHGCCPRTGPHWGPPRPAAQMHSWGRSGALCGSGAGSAAPPWPQGPLLPRPRAPGHPCVVGPHRTGFYAAAWCCSPQPQGAGLRPRPLWGGLWRCRGGSSSSFCVPPGLAPPLKPGPSVPRLPGSLRPAPPRAASVHPPSPADLGSPGRRHHRSHAGLALRPTPRGQQVRPSW